MSTIMLFLFLLWLVEKITILTFLCTRMQYQTKKEFWVDMIIPFFFFGKIVVDKILFSYNKLR